MREFFEKFIGSVPKNKGQENLSPELLANDLLRRNLIYYEGELVRLSNMRDELRPIPVIREDVELNELKKRELNSSIDAVIFSINNDLRETQNVSNDNIEKRKGRLIKIKEDVIGLRYNDLERKAA